ncbi:MAG TPA: Glu-tRNA(Gln) amidotransferase subunit GatE [Myxococcota bacterium]|nr:Glu-tRNA(Gln) amidotransferase subunit GatE [Myxococcota bacterium]
MKKPGIQFAEPEFYEKLGLMCGIEMHRQLHTQHKLFCRCPVKPYSGEYHAEILRHMRPTLSELGEYDPTALMEFKTKKEVLYRLNRDTVCTYEIDDAPPFSLNREALNKAIRMALILNLSLVNEIHIARKQYLDGSIPTGFQRTTILGVNGYMMVDGRRIGIRQLGLEEDACREVSDVAHRRVYLTDRLSIPLIEIVTEAEMHTPADAARVANAIRRTCHLSGVCRFGYGRARQDVNVSIRGGERVEIKGVPSIRQIPALVHYEALRQKALLEIRDRLLAAGVGNDSFEAVVDISDLVKHHPHPAFSTRWGAGVMASAIVLKRCAGILAYPTGPGRTFGAELADRIKVVACIDRMPNCLSSDNPEAFEYADLFDRVRQLAGADSQDAIVMVAGPKNDVETAMKEVRLRMQEALVGVPRETRRSLRNGATGFERVLPGPNRMYPDTDLPPIVLTDEDFARERALCPAPLWEKEDAWKDMGLSAEQIGRLLTTDMFALFDAAAPKVGLKKSTLAYLLLDQLPWLKRRGADVTRVDADFLAGLFGENVEVRQKEASAMLASALGQTIYWTVKGSRNGGESR